MAHQEIGNAGQEFYNALNSMFQGDISAMEQLWSHSNDVTYLGPQGGMLIGWDQVSKAWKKQAEMKLQGTVNPQDIHIIQDGNIAIMQCYEVGQNQVAGKNEQVRIRAVNIFRKENGKWKMISHQTDPLAYLK